MGWVTLLMTGVTAVGIAQSYRRSLSSGRLLTVTE
jgi:hypothetical protein